MESYSANEKILLKFQVENLQNKPFSIEDVSYELKDGKGKVVVTKEQSKDSIQLLEGNIIQIYFCPTYASQYVLDIWYDIPVGGLRDKDGNELDVAIERRTVRFLLPVVR